MYAGYVMAVSIFRPSAAPALPLEARNLRQPDGQTSGVMSLAVLLTIAVGITYLFDSWFGARHPDASRRSHDLWRFDGHGSLLPVRADQSQAQA
jgi:hypothetical protein